MKFILILMLLFSILSIISGIYSIIKGKKKDGVTAIIVGVVIFFIYNFGTRKLLDKKDSSTKNNKEVQLQIGNVKKDLSKKEVVALLKKTSSVDKVETIEGDIGNTLIVTYNTNILSLKTAYETFAYESNQLMRIAKNYKNVDVIKFIKKTEVTYTDGEKAIENLIVWTCKKDTFDKINWDIDIADNYYDFYNRGEYKIDKTVLDEIEIEQKVNLK